MEAIKVGVERGYGYKRIWRMLRESGVEVSRSTVGSYYYKSFGERVRRRRQYLDRAVRIRLFNVVKRLRRQGLSYSKIIERVEKTYGVRLSKTVVSDWLRRVHSPYNGCRIPSIDLLEPSPELAYVIGVVAGDGWAHKTRSGGYRVGAVVKDREFAEEFSRCLGLVLGRDPPEPKPVKDGLFRVCARSKTLYHILQKPIDMGMIRPFIEYSEDCIRSFLRGFFDSEGSVEKNTAKIRCFNTDIKLLEYVQKLLKVLGIEATGPRIWIREGTTYKILGKIGIVKKNVCTITVRAKDRLKFYRVVGFTITRKQQRLEEYLRRRGLLETPPNQPSSYSFSLTHS